LEYGGNNSLKTTPVISVTYAFRILKRECQGYLCAVEVLSPKELDLNNIPVVREFLGVFQGVLG